MDLQEAPRTTAEDNALFPPHLVVTRAGHVAGKFPGDRPAEAYAYALRLAEDGDPTVRLYEVDRRLPPPPAVGTPVAPDDLDWTQLD